MSDPKFSNYLFELGMANKTIQQLEYRLEKILKTCKPFTEDTVHGYLNGLRKDGMGAAGFNKYVQALKHYCNLYEISWGKEFHRVKECAKTKGLLTDDQIDAFIALDPPPSPAGMFWTILSHGMRMIEVRQLDLAHVDFVRGCFVLEKTKNGEGRVHPIHESILETLKAYCAGLKSDLLFPSGYNPKVPLTLEYFEHDFRNRIKTLQINTPNLTPNSFRHTFATRLADDGVDLVHLKDLMGHRSIKSIEHYYKNSLKTMSREIQKDSLGRKHLGKEKRFALFTQNLRELVDMYGFSNVEAEQILTTSNKKIEFSLLLK